MPSRTSVGSPPQPLTVGLSALAILFSLAVTLTIAAPGTAYAGVPSALELDNTDSQTHGYIRIADDPLLQPQAFTLEAWITPAGPGFGNGNFWSILAKPREGAGGSFISSWTLNWSSNTSRIRASVTHTFASSGTEFVSVESIPVGATAHVAMTFDGETIRIFINGEFDNEADFPFPSVYYSDVEDVLIGSANFGAGFVRPFSGQINDVRIWNYARSAGEIAAQMECRLDGDEPGLLAYYTMDEVASDFSGNGHDGVLVGVTNFVPSEIAVEVCEVYHVPAQFPTIQAAIDAAPSGEGRTVLVAPGTYNEAIDLLGKELTVMSSDGPEVTTIDAAGLSDTVVPCVSGENSQTIIQGFTMTGGVGSPAGGMIIADATPRVVDCIFEGNIGGNALAAGALSITGSNPNATPTFTNCVFLDNAGTRGGAMHIDGLGATFNDCQFLGNTSAGNGGAAVTAGGSLASFLAAPRAADAGVSSALELDNAAQSG